jgi:hypothetical protein
VCLSCVEMSGYYPKHPTSVTDLGSWTKVEATVGLTFFGVRVKLLARGGFMGCFSRLILHPGHHNTDAASTVLLLVQSSDFSKD